MVVLAPRRSARDGRLSWVAVLIPAAALGVGVGVLRAVSDGPHALALLAAVATPALAAASPRRAPLALALWLVAWLTHGLLAEAAGVALTILDVVLVWGTPQVGPASTALHAASVPSAAGHPIPRLQDATFGAATMGWLDLVAPALLGVVVRYRMRAAVATGLAAGAWGLLLLVTTTVPATVPTLAGLLVGRL